MKKIATTIFLLLIHIVFVAGIMAAYVDFPYSGGQGQFGFLYIASSGILGFPWAELYWRFGQFLGPLSWLGILVNYAILWCITSVAFNRMFRDNSPGDSADRLTARRRPSVLAKLGVGILLPLVVFTVCQFFLWRLLPPEYLESLAILLGLSLANWWIVPTHFRTHGIVFLAGLLLPATAVVMQCLWAINPHWTGPIAMALSGKFGEFGWLITLLFFLPLLVALVRSQRSPSGDA